MLGKIEIEKALYHKAFNKLIALEAHARTSYTFASEFACVADDVHNLYY